MSNIYLGANYYPEDWDEELVAFDIEKMKECGFNVVRIAEFSWKKMEPVEGEFDFAWLHRVVDKMHAAGIGVIMGTPTATPPHWFAKKFPEAPMLHEDGVRNSHGGRRHCCSNNPDYIRYSEKIVEKLAEEFGGPQRHRLLLRSLHEGIPSTPDRKIRGRGKVEQSLEPEPFQSSLRRY